MQKHFHSGADALEDGGADAQARLERAMRDEHVRAVTLHKENSEITRSNGRKYRVNKHGQWVRVR